MRVPYGVNKEYFRYSLFLVFCNRLTTSAVSAGSLLVNCSLLIYLSAILYFGIVLVSACRFI